MAVAAARLCGWARAMGLVVAAVAVVVAATVCGVCGSGSSATARRGTRRGGRQWGLATRVGGCSGSGAGAGNGTLKNESGTLHAATEVEVIVGASHRILPGTRCRDAPPTLAGWFPRCPGTCHKEREGPAVLPRKRSCPATAIVDVAPAHKKLESILILVTGCVDAGTDS